MTITKEDAKRVLARKLYERKRALADPLYLMSFMVGTDQRDGEHFNFQHLRDPLEPGEITMNGNALVRRDKTWRWQRHAAERILQSKRLIMLKGRQIGVTWIVLAADVAEAITVPGSSSLLFRQREDEAIDNVRRWWTLYQSLPAHFKEGIRVIRPDKAILPGRDGIGLMFQDGSISEVIPMSSAASSGHGRSVRRVIADEAAYIEKFAEIMAAVEPAAGRAAISLISTANGRSNPETGEGNEYHRRWVTADEVGYERLFLPFDVHPDRDEDWYRKAPEVQSLRVHQRNAQFPRDEHEAFALTNRTFIDPDVLQRYRGKIAKPLYRADFVDENGNLAKHGEARLKKHDGGRLSVFEPPREDVKYAIGADVATGRGADYSACVVVDLSTMAIAAEFRGKMDADQYAAQLHYLGRWYNTALLAVESAGGYGEAVIIPLRDGRAGRPAYPNQYRHVLSSRPDLPIAKPYGFPTNIKTRPLILNQLEKALREDAVPQVSDALMWELEELVYHDVGASPRASDGAHDDLVMATAIALEMYRLKGSHPDRQIAQPPRRTDIRGPGPKKSRGAKVDLTRYST